MKKIVLAVTLLLCVYGVNAQRMEVGFKLGALVNSDPAFVDGVVPVTGFMLMFRPHNGYFQAGPVAELGIDNGRAVLALGPDFNVPINIGKIGYIYPGIDMRLMSAYNDAAFSVGMHAGLNLRLTKRMSFNAEAGPRAIWFGAYPGHNYLAGSGSAGLRFNM